MNPPASTAPQQQGQALRQRMQQQDISPKHRSSWQELLVRGDQLLKEMEMEVSSVGSAQRLGSSQSPALTPATQIEPSKDHGSITEAPAPAEAMSNKLVTGKTS